MPSSARGLLGDARSFLCGKRRGTRRTAFHSAKPAQRNGSRIFGPFDVRGRLHGSRLSRVVTPLAEASCLRAVSHTPFACKLSAATGEPAAALLLSGLCDSGRGWMDRRNAKPHPGALPPLNKRVGGEAERYRAFELLIRHSSRCHRAFTSGNVCAMASAAQAVPAAEIH